MTNLEIISKIIFTFRKNSHSPLPNLLSMQKEIFNRLNRIDHLIRIKGTGTPSELAEKIGMSERSMYEYIKLMKDFGCPVSYSRSRKSYYYQEDGSFTIRFVSE